MAVTPYTVSASLDPQYAAITAQLTAQEQTARKAAALRTRQLNDNLAFNTAKINYDAPAKRIALRDALRARGVGVSGEATTRLNELNDEIAMALSNAQNSAMQGRSSVDSDLSRALADIDVRREQAIADSRMRAQQRQDVLAKQKEQKQIAQLPPGIDFYELKYGHKLNQPARPVAHPQPAATLVPVRPSATATGRASNPLAGLDLSGFRTPAPPSVPRAVAPVRTVVAPRPQPMPAPRPPTVRNYNLVPRSGAY